MKEKQLLILAKLMRSNTDSIAFRGAKLVLVDGLKISEAAKSLGTIDQTVSNGVSRYQNANNEIKTAYEIGE